MRILHLATQAPDFKYGGAIGTYLFSYALTHICNEVDYVGPSIENVEIRDLYQTTTFIDGPINDLQKALTFLRFYFNRNYIGWKNISIDFNKYDVIFVEFTKMDYYIKDILKFGYRGKIIVRAHNVEHDFYKVNYESDRTVMNWLKYKVSARRESYMVHNCDSVFAITKEDKYRLVELYDIDPDRIKIFPVCVNEIDEKRKQTGEIHEKLRCLITGTLAFGPNSEATLWFIKNVFPFVKDICELTIAGYKPNAELTSICDANGIRVIDTPDSMEPLFKESDMVLAPIFDGGGMKVKIGEAMSYDLPIVTTDHGNIGYNLENGINGFIANSSREFIQSIDTYSKMNYEQRTELLEREWNHYKEKYSLNSAVDRLLVIIEGLKADSIDRNI